MRLDLSKIRMILLVHSDAKRLNKFGRISTSFDNQFVSGNACQSASKDRDELSKKCRC